MKFIDFFAGVGGFRRGMEMAGHECVGFCEWDKFATASYTAMHLATPEQLEYLATLPKNKRVKEILKDEYRGNEWFSNDVRSVNAGNVPRADCFCFGAPCQDFSIAGQRKGLEGNRSVLVNEIFRIVEEIDEEDRPEWLIYENVKGMFSSNGGWDYAAILHRLDELGYDAEWQLFNSKYYIPQNRERIYTIGHNRRYGTRKILPITRTSEENNIYKINQIGRVDTDTRKNTNNYRVYDTNGLAPALNSGEGAKKAHIAVMQIGKEESHRNNPNQHRVYDTNGLAPTLNTMAGGGREPHIIEPLTHIERKYSEFFRKNGYIPDRFEAYNAREINEVHPTLTAASYGVPGHTGTVLFKEEREMIPDESARYVWYEPKQCYVAIRKLTPRECFRLQGWKDEYFDRAELVNYDSQLYKQAGNGVTVPVVYDIARRL